jgi:hypothetical protein
MTFGTFDTMQNDKIAPINPVIHAIPEGQQITVLTSRGERFTGTDDTTGEEAEKGLFVLYAMVREGSSITNKKTYLLAADVVGFELYYNA